MKFFRILSVLSLIVLITTGCATKTSTTLILLSDEDGQTGKVIVSTDKGSRVISQAGTGVTISWASEVPSEPFAVNEEEIQARFKQILSNTPIPISNFNLYFESGKTVLLMDSETIIKDIVTAIHKTPFPRVGVVGHSDRAGNKAYNEKLSMRRAKTIRKKIIEMGVNPDFIVEVTSHGENNPAVWTEDGVAEPKNRRVEIIVR